MLPQEHPPLITETAFDCPHCGAFTTQKWYDLYSHEIPNDERVPRLPARDALQQIAADPKMDESQKQSLSKWIRKIQTGRVFNEKRESPYINLLAYNLFLSECFNCGKIAIWVYDSIVSPPSKFGLQPNQNLPEEIVSDFEEARSIANLSPRGAAALLRLCIQKLSIALGESGKNLDADIAELVKKGLDPLVQKSLDIVRVIGNESVHPGELDLKDDVETVSRLFELVNAVTDQMISHPKHVAELYDKLPKEKRKAIESRNERNTKT